MKLTFVALILSALDEAAAVVSGDAVAPATMAMAAKSLRGGARRSGLGSREGLLPLSGRKTTEQNLPDVAVKNKAAAEANKAAAAANKAAAEAKKSAASNIVSQVETCEVLCTKLCMKGTTDAGTTSYPAEYTQVGTATYLTTEAGAYTGNMNAASNQAVGPENKDCVAQCIVQYCKGAEAGAAAYPSEYTQAGTYTFNADIGAVAYPTGTTEGGASAVTTNAASNQANVPEVAACEAKCIKQNCKSTDDHTATYPAEYTQAATFSYITTTEQPEQQPASAIAGTPNMSDNAACVQECVQSCQAGAAAYPTTEASTYTFTGNIDAFAYPTSTTEAGAYATATNAASNQAADPENKACEAQCINACKGADDNSATYPAEYTEAGAAAYPTAEYAQTATFNYVTTAEQPEQQPASARPGTPNMSDNAACVQACVEMCQADTATYPTTEYAQAGTYTFSTANAGAIAYSNTEAGAYATTTNAASTQAAGTENKACEAECINACKGTDDNAATYTAEYTEAGAAAYPTAEYARTATFNYVTTAEQPEQQPASAIAGTPNTSDNAACVQECVQRCEEAKVDKGGIFKPGMYVFMTYVPMVWYMLNVAHLKYASMLTYCWLICFKIFVLFSTSAKAKSP